MNEEIHDSLYPFLPEVPVSQKERALSLHTIMFSVRSGSHREVWRAEGRPFGGLENSEMQPLLTRGL